MRATPTISQNYNPDMIWPTAILFACSLLYYMYKFISLRQNRNVIIQQAEQSSQRTSEPERNINPNVEPNQNELNSNPQERPSTIKLIFKTTNTSNDVSVDVDINLNFESVFTLLLKSKLKVSLETHKVMFIFRGRQINHNLSVKDVEGLENGSTIHLFITVKAAPSSNEASSSNRSNSSENQESAGNSGNNSVYYSTIKVHAFIAVIFFFFVKEHKSDKELLRPSALLLLQLLFAIWIIQLSHMIAKLYVYREIIYESPEN